MSDILVLVTGGTIDKVYDPIRGNLGFAAETNIRALLRQGRCQLPRGEVRIETLMLKDSLDMVQADREAIRDAVARATADRIVVTHGTDTLVETAGVIAGGAAGKTVVLAGAMVPWSVGGSDGLFNLGAAVAAVQLLPPGVYVVMNGGVFTWPAVRKNREAGRFEPA